jgi:hypothetical protein
VTANSDLASAKDDDTWDPPTTFREGLEDTERVAQMILDQLDGQLVVPVADVEFLARKVHRLARAAHLALPPEVT